MTYGAQKNLKGIRKEAIEMIRRLKKLTYEERLKKLNMYTVLTEEHHLCSLSEPDLLLLVLFLVPLSR